MRQLLSIIALSTLGFVLAFGQGFGGKAGMGGKAGFGGGAVVSLTPSFVGYTYVVGTNSTPITSPALTLSTSDGVFVYCGSGYSNGTPTALTATSTPSASFTAETLQGSGTVWGQLSFAAGMASGSTTFTCTATGTAQYMAMVVLQYHNMPSNTANTSTGTYVASNTTFTTGSFTTTQRTLNVLCTQSGTNSTTWAAGLIGGNSATLRGVDGGSSLSANSDGACEDYISSALMSGVTGAITFIPSSGNLAGTLVAVNY